MSSRALISLPPISVPPRAEWVSMLSVIAAFGLGVATPVQSQGLADRAAQRASREQHMQMRQQLRAEHERRLAAPAVAPAPAAAPGGANRNQLEPAALPQQRGLSPEERVQLREQLRQASRQRKAPSEPFQP